MKIHQIAVFLQNKPGHLSGICRTLADQGINIVTLSLADTQQFGILRLIVKEWEKAARGIDGRAYPWGCWELDRCNTYEAGIGATTPVGAYSPVGDSPYGCVDMAGNVWEWTATHDGLGLVVRGGSFVNERHQAACTFRDWDLPESGLRLYGFRIAVSSLEAAMG